MTVYLSGIKIHLFLQPTTTVPCVDSGNIICAEVDSNFDLCNSVNLGPECCAYCQAKTTPGKMLN